MGRTTSAAPPVVHGSNVKPHRVDHTPQGITFEDTVADDWWKIASVIYASSIAKEVAVYN